MMLSEPRWVAVKVACGRGAARDHGADDLAAGVNVVGVLDHATGLGGFVVGAAQVDPRVEVDAGGALPAFHLHALALGFGRMTPTPTGSRFTMAAALQNRPRLSLPSPIGNP